MEQLSSKKIPTVCTTCGVRPPRWFPFTLFGALTLSERALCTLCSDLEDAEMEGRGPPADDDFTHLGPIQFDTLLESLRGAARIRPAEVLRWYAAIIRQIAQAHGQVIPIAVESYLTQFEEEDNHSGAS